MNTQENNKLIAEFMGWTFDEDYDCWFDKNGIRKTFEKGESLHFDTNWNRIMEVVERINDLNNVVRINENEVLIVNNERGETIVEVVSGTMFEAVYNACVEFVNWYNQNK